MNTADLIARCKQRYKDLAGRIITDDEWLLYLNEAYEEVIAAHPDWPWLHMTDQQTLAPGASEIPLDGYTTRVLSVYNRTDGIHMRPLPDTTGLHLDYYTPDSTGAPEAYRYLQGPAADGSGRDPKIVVFPTPDKPTVFDIETYGDMLVTAPLMPPAAHTILVHGALAKAYEDDDEFVRSDRHRGLFLGMLHNLIVLAGVPSTEGYPGVLDSF